MRVVGGDPVDGPGRFGLGQRRRRELNSTLEHELLSRRHFATKDQARRQVARFIDAYYHRHSSCETLPPVVFEALLAERTAAAAGPERAA
jgi:hypothetical protein